MGLPVNTHIALGKYPQFIAGKHPYFIADRTILPHPWKFPFVFGQIRILASERIWGFVLLFFPWRCHSRHLLLKVLPNIAQPKIVFGPRTCNFIANYRKLAFTKLFLANGTAILHGFLNVDALKDLKGFLFRKWFEAVYFELTMLAFYETVMPSN